MNRRNFLRLTVGVAAAASVNWRLWAAPTGGSGTRFLMVFLRGGYDSLSALVPYTEPFYYESRPHIALAKPDINDPNTVVDLDGRWGLHPNLQDTLRPLYSAGQLAFVPFSGPGFESRSHFQSQDWIEWGQPPVANPDAGSGFLNRLLANLGKGAGVNQSAVSFTENLPPILHGRIQVANSPIKLPGNRGSMDVSYENLLQAMYTGHSLESMAREGFGLRHKISNELLEEMQTASRGALPAKGFALEAARIGRLLHDQPNYTLGFIDVGGWDTHVAQGGVHGNLSNRLLSLGAGLKALSEGLGDSWKNTVVVVLSEFGRTFLENGSGGTDHGHGTTLWVLGGGVRGGAIRGEQSRLSRLSDLHQNRDTPVLNEYRATLGGLFKRIYGLDAKALNDVFPDSKPRDIGLI